MKKKLLLIVSAFIYLTTTAQNEFIMLIQTNAPGATGTNFELPIRTNVAYDLTINWGDGSALETYSTPSSSQSSIPHTYATDGQYIITITAPIPGFHSFHFGTTGGAGTPNNRRKVLEIQQWGNLYWQTFEGAFVGCENMNITATDAPDLSVVSNMSGAFSSCIALNADINHWSVGGVVNMASTFGGCTNFNQPLNDWDVSSVTNFSRMFENCTAFNQNLNSWNVAAAQVFSFMFKDCTNFNGDITTWNTASATNMTNMFFGCTNFNQPIGNWNVSNVTNLGSMFFNATNFNQSLNNWNTSSVNNMSGMFWGCTNFNGNISAWNTSGVTNMGSMFLSCTNFNQAIGGWNVGNVTNMQQMFRGASSFNQPLNNWNTSSVVSFGFIEMFFIATNFNQPLNNWNVSGGTSFSSMFIGCTNFNQDLDNWNVSNSTNFNGMFGGCTNFNGNVTSWTLNTNSNFQAINMFADCNKFNQNLSGWNLTRASALGGFLNGTSISPCVLDTMLVAWSQQSLNANVSIGLQGLRTTTVGDAARQLIVTNSNWIFDGGFSLGSLSISPSVDCGFLDKGSVSMGFNPFSQSALNTYSLTGATSANTTANASTNFFNLPVGNYNISITDATGCQLFDDSFDIIGADNPEVTSSTITPVSCTQDSTGAISITTTGADIEWYDIDYNYINDGVNQIDDLPVGSYFAQIYLNSCSIKDTFEVAQGAVDATIAVNGNNISVTITEGLAPFIIVWSGPDGIISETSTELTDMPNGTYTATVRDASFCEKTLTATVSGTSISNLENTIVSIYPNPTSSILNIELDKETNIEIMGITGIKITEMSGASQYQYNTSSLAAGLYFIKAGEQTMKFVKN